MFFKWSKCDRKYSQEMKFRLHPNVSDHTLDKVLNFLKVAVQWKIDENVRDVPEDIVKRSDLVK